MTSAPSPVADIQLKDLGIEVRPDVDPEKEHEGDENLTE